MDRLPSFTAAFGILFVVALAYSATFSALQAVHGQSEHLRRWTRAWIALAGYAVSVPIAYVLIGFPELRPLRIAASTLSYVFAWWHLDALMQGMHQLCRPARRATTWNRWMVAAPLATAIALSIESINPASVFRGPGYLIRVALLSFAWAGAFAWSGTVALRAATHISPLGRRMLATAFFGYALIRMLDPLAPSGSLPPMLELALTFGDLPVFVMVGTGILLALLDVERARAITAVQESIQAQRAASESEAALAAAISNSADAVCVLDSELRIVAFNAPFATLLRESRGLIVTAGMPVGNLPTGAARDEWHAAFARAFAGTPQVMRVTIGAAPGRAAHVLSFRITPLRRNAEVTGVLIVCHDVTEEDRLRAELEHRDQRFRSLIEHSSDIILMLDRTGAIEYASPSVTRVLGWSPSDMERPDAFTFLHPEDVASLREAMLRALQGDATRTRGVTLRARTQGGDYVRLEALSRHFMEVDGTPRLIVSLRDVRERDRLEAELFAARRLESLGRLAGGIAHDFNNLLTAILGNVSLLRKLLPTGSDARAHIEEIDQSGRRGADLTRRMLAFARRQMIEPRVMDLGSQVHSLERLLRRLLGEDIELTLVTPPSPWYVRADSTAIEQALVNLAVNARDAMPKGGQLSVTVSHCALDDASHDALGVPAGEWVRVDVEDSGVGIDEQTLSRLFEPFFSTKGPTGGTGLGLATVHGIISQANGHVRVRSTPGTGTTFSLFLPRVADATPAAAAEPPSSEMPRSNPAETILLIEDEESVRLVTARLLKGLGYQVITASDGAEAVSIAAAHAGVIDAVVSDLVMPRLGGAEAVARIRQSRPTIGVLFVSGFSEEALAWREAMPQGGRLVTKPFTLSQLAIAVRHAIDTAVHEAATPH